MRTPPADISAVLQTAAVRWQVPYTLLAALAWRESEYDPSRPGRKLEDGRQALGLFQWISDDAAAAFGCDDRTDKAQASDAAAHYIANLVERYAWDWTLVLSAWNWGPSNVDKRIETGKPIPPEVLTFAEDVQAARRILQRWGWEEAKKGNVPGQQKLDLSPSALQRLDQAVRDLAQANPGNKRSQALLEMWSRWYTPAKGNAPDSSMLEKAQQEMWFTYAETYDRAPLTPARIPPPWEIAPSVWPQFRDRLLAWLDNARAQTKRVKDALRLDPVTAITVDDPMRYEPTQQGIGFLPLLAAFIVFLTLERRR